MLREILQELEYNNPPMDNAKAVQGATQVATHSRSTNESKAGQAQETIHFSGKNLDSFEAFCHLPNVMLTAIILYGISQTFLLENMYVPCH
jgi:hypothetical protein